MLTWHWEIIVSRLYSMRFDMNSTVWKLTVTETWANSMLKNYVTMSSNRSVVPWNADWDADILLRLDILISVYLSMYCWDFGKITNAW